MYGLPVIDHREIAVMTVDYAHRVMQTHMECLLSVCPVKRQAKARLIEAGHLVSADTPHIGF